MIKVIALDLVGVLAKRNDFVLDKTDEICFVDDTLENIVGANDVGIIHTIHMVILIIWEKQLI